MESIVVVIQDFNVLDQERRRHFDMCISKHLQHPSVACVLSISEKGFENTAFKNHAKMRNLHASGSRLTFEEAIRVTNDMFCRGTIIGLFNLDTYMTGEGWSSMSHYLPQGSNIVLCLGRHEVEGDGSLKLNPQLEKLAHANSQDAWVWRAPLENVRDCAFELGTVGCDNAIAHRFKEAGFVPMNLMFHLKLAHVDPSANEDAYRRRIGGIKDQPEKRGSYLVPCMGADGTYQKAMVTLMQQIPPSIQHHIVTDLYNRLMTIRN